MVPIVIDIKTTAHNVVPINWSIPTKVEAFRWCLWRHSGSKFVKLYPIDTALRVHSRYLNCFFSQQFGPLEFLYERPIVRLLARVKNCSFARSRKILIKFLIETFFVLIWKFSTPDRHRYYGKPHGSDRLRPPIKRLKLPIDAKKTCTTWSRSARELSDRPASLEKVWSLSINIELDYIAHPCCQILSE